MTIKTIKQLERGEYFTLKPVEEPDENIVWVRGDYVGNGEYSVYKFADINHERFMKRERKVYTEFTF